MVIGILIALQVDNWNEDKTRARHEQQYLRRLQKDLQMDWVGIDTLLKRHNTRVENVQSFIKYFGKDTIQIETFNNLFWALSHSDDFFPNDDTYMEMVSSGKLDLIQSDKLKEAILDIHSHYEQIDDFEEHLEWDRREYIYKLQIGLFNWKTIDGEYLEEKMFLAEFKRISSNIQLQNSFLLFSSVSNKLTRLYESGIDKIDQLDAMINEELHK